MMSKTIYQTNDYSVTCAIEYNRYRVRDKMIKLMFITEDPFNGQSLAIDVCCKLQDAKNDGVEVLGVTDDGELITGTTTGTAVEYNEKREGWLAAHDALIIAAQQQKTAHQILADERQRKGIHPGGALSGGMPNYSGLKAYDPWEDVKTFPAKPGTLYFIRTKTGGLYVARFADDGYYHRTETLDSRIENVIKVMEVPK